MQLKGCNVRADGRGLHPLCRQDTGWLRQWRWSVLCVVCEAFMHVLYRFFWTRYVQCVGYKVFILHRTHGPSLLFSLQIIWA